jgi:glycosyltransferase involved in cell wall biosynthesis
MEPFLSVIIGTYNRANLLQICLDALCRQTLEPAAYEIVVVDNNSTDETDHLVFKYIGGRVSVRYVFEKSQGFSFARNRGYREAKGLYLVFNDDDTKAPPEYLSNVSKAIEKHAPDILGGPVYPFYTTARPFWFRDVYEIRKYEHKSGFSSRCRVSGGNFIVKKSLLPNLGLFDVEIGMKGNHIGLGGEAKVLNTYRLKTPEDKQKVYYALDCHVLHHVPAHKMRIGYMMKRSYLSGRMHVRLLSMKEKRTIAALVIRKPISLAVISVLEIFHPKLRGPDFVIIGKRSALIVGILVEGLYYLLRKPA